MGWIVQMKNVNRGVVVWVVVIVVVSYLFEWGWTMNVRRERRSREAVSEYGPDSIIAARQ